MATQGERDLIIAAQIKNQVLAQWWGAAVAGLILLCTLENWILRLAHRYNSDSGSLARMITMLSRIYTRFVTGLTFGDYLFLPHRILIVFVYFAMNIVLTFLGVDWSMVTFFASRLGWMTLLNLCLVIFLGLKNTPLSPLAGRSYEDLNMLHRSCGYTTILYMVIHACTYIGGLGKYDALYVMRTTAQYSGAAAGIAMLAILATAIGFVRKRQYELFYVVHIAMVAIILVLVGLHQPSLRLKAFVLTTLAGAMWVIDRLLRLSRWLYYGMTNHCALTPLPDGGTRLRMRHSIKAAPGSHVFLWVPGVCATQSHPFTLISSRPAEFMVAAKDGFTRRLYDVACEHPGQELRASIEGPYGQVPDARQYDKVVLIAGGSGATFTFALALDWARNVRLRKRRSTLQFVWSTKSNSHLQWFANELTELRSCAAAEVRLHVTGPNDRSLKPSEVSFVASLTDPEKGVLKISAARQPSQDYSSGEISSRARPDVNAVLDSAMCLMSPDKRILIAASGPSDLLADVRIAAASQMRMGLPSVDLHLEVFGW